MSEKKPVIGMVGLTRWTDNGTWKSYEHAFTSIACINSVFRNGGIPVIIPANVIADDVENAMSMCDGVYFPGGPDVNPWLYGEEPHQMIAQYRPEIDDASLKAADYALHHKLPMLGICRGVQILNVFMGGSLWQDVTLQEGQIMKHLQVFDREYVTHKVTVQEDTRLAEILGAGEHKVNSLHHQAVKAVGRGLKVNAIASDGTIEGVEDEDGLILGVQWHPENLLDSAPEMNKLFQDLVRRSLEK